MLQNQRVEGVVGGCGEGEGGSEHDSEYSCSTVIRPCLEFRGEAHPPTHSLNADHVEAFNPNNMISGWVVGWI